MIGDLSGVFGSADNQQYDKWLEFTGKLCPTRAGARASANLCGLIETAKANGIKPWRYLNHLFEVLPAQAMGMGLVGIHWRYVSNTNTARRGKTVSIRGRFQGTSHWPTAPVEGLPRTLLLRRRTPIPIKPSIVSRPLPGSGTGISSTVPGVGVPSTTKSRELSS